MAKIRADFVKETSLTTGTGNITLAGVRPPARAFSTVATTSDTFKYAIVHQALNEWEVGTGTILTSTTFSRSVLASSNANALVNFSAGTKNVDLVCDSADLTAMEEWRAVTTITANAAATNATTNLSFGTFTFPANTLTVGQMWEFFGYFTFLHTAAATPTLTLELLVNGAVVDSTVMTPQSTATTFGCTAKGLLTCRTIGSSGTIQANCTIDSGNSVLATGNEGSTSTATDTINTTVDRSTEMRIRMTTAVASNTLTVLHGYIKRIR